MRSECERLADDGADVALVVQHSDRLARGDGRTAKHLVEYALWAIKVGVSIISVQDPQTFRDLLYAVVTGQRNHEDSARKSAAVRDGLRPAFERGQRGGGPTPDGYELVVERDDRDTVIARSYRHDPERAPLIRLIADLYEQGMGDPSVARELNRRGHRTRSGKPWIRRRIQDVLTNHFYAGRIMRDRGKASEQIRNGKHPPIIEPDRFDRLLELRASRDLAAGSERQPPKQGRPASNHALAGLARCGACGELMCPRTSSYRRTDGSRRRTYLCAHVTHATGLCSAPVIDAELVDSTVIAKLDGYLGDFDAWRSEIERGHVQERQRLAHEVEKANAPTPTPRRWWSSWNSTT